MIRKLFLYLPFLNERNEVLSEDHFAFRLSVQLCVRRVRSIILRF